MKIIPIARYRNKIYYYVYPCPYCDNKYRYMRNVQDHIKKEHKNAK